MGKRKASEGAEGTIAKAPKLSNEGPASDSVRNKEKVLVLSTRGVTFRYRHLMNDLIALLPHCKKESKLDTKSDRGVLNEVADLKNCSSVIFFEVRKKKDLYIWMAKSPDGPSVKFHVVNVHTMAELKLTGNHLKGARPVLSFDPGFDLQPHFQLLKEMLTQVFATPKGHPKSKPFFDHVISFSIADGRIWMRNYQVVTPLDKKKFDEENTTLVEVGPRLTMNPIKIFASSFGGATIYENPNYVSPNTVRSMLKKQQSAKYVGRVEQRKKRKEHKAANPLPRSELEDVFVDDE